MDIVIVDDSLGLVDLIEPLLASAGHRLRFISRHEALAFSGDDLPFDACVVELDQNRAESSSILPALRKTARNPWAVAWSASDQLWRGSFETRSFDAFLAKPTSFAMLLAALEGRLCPACGQPMDADHAHPLCHFTQDEGSGPAWR